MPLNPNPPAVVYPGQYPASPVSGNRRRRKKSVILLTPRNKILLFIIHLIAGLLITRDLNPWNYIGYGFVVVSMFQIIKTRNRNNIAAFCSIYIAGNEVYFRMLRTDIFWHFNKYAIILMLTAGVFYLRKKKKTNIYWLYLFLMLPSIFVINLDELIIPMTQILSVSYAGPVILALSTTYFMNVKFTKKQLSDFFYCLILGITPSVSYLILNITQLENIEFTEYSNMATSAGYGPNQVSTALGLGIVILFYSKVIQIQVLKFKISDWIFLGVAAFLSILTFSRGGTISALIAGSSGFFYAQLHVKTSKKFYKTLFVGGMSAFLIYQSIVYLNNISDGTLYSRYTIGEEEDQTKFLTGRDRIIAADLKIFLDYPLLGVGPGMGLVERANYGTAEMISAHTEFSRAVAEHGIFGLFSVLIMLIYPVSYFKKSKSRESRILMIICLLFSLLTMGHSAMRLALTCFIYGLSFIKVSNDP